MTCQDCGGQVERSPVRGPRLKRCRPCRIEAARLRQLAATAKRHALRRSLLSDPATVERVAIETRNATATHAVQQRITGDHGDKYIVTRCGKRLWVQLVVEPGPVVTCGVCARTIKGAT